ncbi:hypothetical protein K402DRAFT_232969 [Aulographum hederae CBS 113979]|uniref:Uncharacterized protein n=1 Tax=Aulographum hederae CBS 113979 TaxID=1176131 RepID=A0A6G1GLP5_9PEZI|nr:hypothetical protein K402DRAFT_441757 [Aulographum hederae CBS 113979]KAF1981638.1 hypothetical protein K402DRAFT_232969 [Aulographum hederae CBS 113979]
MDGAQACYPYLAVEVSWMLQRVGRCNLCDEGSGVIPVQTQFGTDLGDSSKYSNENFED